VVWLGLFPGSETATQPNAAMAEETTISEAPATESGAENDNAGILTVEDLANSFADRVEADAEEKPTEAEATEATEAESAEAAEEEEDVLSQTISQEDDDETPEEETEAEESAEEESEGESPAVGRLLKQVGKLTARAKGAEETVEAMKAEITSLKTQGTGKAEAQGSPVLDDVGNLEDLEKVRQEALSAKKWAMTHLGKDYVESDGKEYDGDQIREIFAAADEYLTEKIPARSQFLEQRKQWQVDANATFPWLESQDGELYELYLQLRGSDQYGAILDALPNGDFVGATLARGVKGVQDDQAAQGKPKKKKSAQAKPPPSQEGDAAPPVQSKQARSQARKNKALGKGVISEGQLAAYLTE